MRKLIALLGIVLLAGCQIPTGNKTVEEKAPLPPAEESTPVPVAEEEPAAAESTEKADAPAEEVAPLIE